MGRSTSRRHRPPPRRAVIRRRRAGALLVLVLLAGLGVVAGSLATEVRDRLDAPLARDTTAGGAITGVAAPTAADRDAGSGPLDPGTAETELPALPGHLDFARPDALPMRFGHKPRAVLAFDLDDGRVLVRRRPHRAFPVASLTKVMTALVAADLLRDEQRVRIPRAAKKVGGSIMGGLLAGRRVRARTLMQGLLIQSGNDAAVALAHGAAGSERRFVRLMNQRARRLGLRCTRFVNAHGLGGRNVSCAADLAEMSVRAMAEPRIARIVKKRRAKVWLPKRHAWWLLTTNPLLRAGDKGILGLKTGYTVAAGRCLITVARRNGRRIGIVVLGASDPGGTTRRLLKRLPAAF